MGDLTKVGTSLLEMDDIAEFLNVAKEFTTKDEIENAGKGKKIEKVAGIEAGRVAQSIPSDRTTIRNATLLDEHPADYFLSKASGDGIIRDTTNIKKTYSAEMKELRDEVYQLRMELSKCGVTVPYANYAGFYDIFREKSPAHINAAVANAIEDSRTQYEIKIQDDKFSQFVAGDKVMLKSLLSGETAVLTIDRLEPDGETVHFSSASGFDIKKDKCEVYKSKGNLINGTFTFGEITPERPGNKEFYSCLDDDTFRTRLSIKKSHTGFGYTFRIPAARQKNYLSKVEVQIKKFGNPGDLMCYIIDERNIQNWKNAAKAEEDGIIIAKSQPLEVDIRLGEHLADFSFYDGTQYPLLKEVDTTDHKIRYCMIIEALSVDDSNYYELVFLQNKKDDGTFDDLQLNNITYNYTEKEDRSTDQALITDAKINATDLYYGVTLIEAVTEVFTPYEDGIYTAKFKTHEPVEVSKGRLTMRIAREGMFTVDPTGTSALGNLGDGGVIVAKGKTHDDVSGFTRCVDKDVIVGTTIRNVANVLDNKLTLKKGMYVESGDPVYPIGYTVFIKAKRTIWNETDCKLETVDSARFSMPLSVIMPDGHKKSDEISDRLIFECDFIGNDMERHYFNEFEIQVCWEKSCKDIAANFAGRIHDLSLSLDRSI